MKRARPPLRLFLAAALLLALAIALRSFWVEAVLQPMTLVVWLALRVLGTVDQEVWWVLLILLVFVLGLRSLPVEPAFRKAYQPPEHKPPAQRVAYWQSVLRKEVQANGQPVSVRAQLRELLVAVVAQEERTSPERMREALKNRQLALPARLVDFLEASEPAEAPLLQRLLSAAPFLHRRLRAHQDASDERLAHETLQWIETIVENKLDG